MKNLKGVRYLYHKIVIIIKTKIHYYLIFMKNNKLYIYAHLPPSLKNKIVSCISNVRACTNVLVFGPGVDHRCVVVQVHKLQSTCFLIVNCDRQGTHYGTIPVYWRVSLQRFFYSLYTYFWNSGIEVRLKIFLL